MTFISCLLLKSTFKTKSDPDILQASITQSQNPRYYFPVVFSLANRGPYHILKTMICQHIAGHRQFPGTIKFTDRPKILTFAFKSHDKYFHI